jgi:hypothetical protein
VCKTTLAAVQSRRVTTRGPLIHAYIPMNKENQLLITNDPVELRNKLLKFKSSRKSPTIEEESKEYTHILINKKSESHQHCNRLDLETLGS